MLLREINPFVPGSLRIDHQRLSATDETWIRVAITNPRVCERLGIPDGISQSFRPHRRTFVRASQTDSEPIPTP